MNNRLVFVDESLAKELFGSEIKDNLLFLQSTAAYDVYAGWNDKGPKEIYRVPRKEDDDRG